MPLLILGLALWIGAHLFKRIAPGPRAAMGDAGKAVVAVALLASVVLMVIGYRGAPYVPVYDPLPGMGHVNNTLMFVAVFLFGVGGTKGSLYPRMRHPMLWGTVIWAVAHLLVNGDLASVDPVRRHRTLGAGVDAGHQPGATLDAARRADAGCRGDVMNLAGTAVLYGAIAGVHIWLGYNPFMGT